MPKKPPAKPEPSQPLSEAAREATASLDDIPASTEQARGTNLGQIKALQPHVAVIWAKIEGGMTRKTIHAAYKKKGFTLSYSAFARFVSENKPTSSNRPPTP